MEFSEKTWDSFLLICSYFWYFASLATDISLISLLRGRLLAYCGFCWTNYGNFSSALYGMSLASLCLLLTSLFLLLALTTSEQLYFSWGIIYVISTFKTAVLLLFICKGDLRKFVFGCIHLVLSLRTLFCLICNWCKGRGISSPSIAYTPMVDFDWEIVIVS